MADKIKLVIAALITGLGIGVFYYLGEQPLIVRVLALLAMIAVAVTVAWRTEAGGSVVGFGRGALTEIRKVVWPTRRETVQTTLVVFAMVVVVGIILWLFDWMLAGGVRILTGQGS